IAKALWLANQAQSYRTSGNTTGGLLLAVEAQKQAAAVTTSGADQIEKEVTQNFVYSALLSALNESTSLSQAGEVVFQANLTDVPLSNVDQYFPVARSLWVLSNSALVTVTLPDKGIEHVAVSGDGRSLVFSNDAGEIAWMEAPSPSALSSQEPLELSFTTLPDNQGGSINALALSQDGRRLAVIRCRSTATSAAAATAIPATPTPTSSPPPREEQVCSLQLWQMDSQGSLARVNQECEPRANDATSLTFLSGDSRLVWHDQQNLLTIDFRAQQCNPDSVPLPQQPVHTIAYLPGEDPSTGFLFTAANQGDCPACNGWLQWWQVRRENSDLDIKQLGTPQQLISGLTAVQPILDPPAIVTVNQSNQFIWYNTAVADWPAIACGLAGRNLTATEWRTAFPTLNFDTVYAQDLYTDTCTLYGLDYGLDISFAEEKLNEAAIELRKCNRTAQETAAVIFAQAYAYAQESQETLPSESSFENWGLQTLAQHILEDNAPAMGNCINQMVSLYQSSEASILDRSALQDMVTRLRRVSTNIFRENYDHETALDELQTLPPQITALPSVLQPIFRQKLTNLYNTMCFTINVAESCQLLIAMAERAVQFDQPQRSNTERHPMWRFDGQAGEVVVLTMNAEESRLDPFLRVLDEQGAVIAVNDDSGGSLNSLIVLSLPESGTYFVSTSGYGGSSGAYVLTLARNLPMLALGDAVSGNAATTPLWQLELQAGDIISVTMRPTDNKDTVFLTLLDANGNYLRDGNRYEAGLPAEISLFVAPETGAYFIQTGSSGDGNRVYELSVEERATRPLTPNQTETAHTQDGTVWAFEAQAGDVVSITLTTADDNLNAYLALHDGLWNQWGYAEVGYGNRRGNTDMVSLYQAGTYYVEVGTYDDSSGNYDLTLTQDSLPPATIIVDEASGVGTAVSTTLDNLLWQFTGRAGDRVTIDLESPNEFFDPYLTLIAPSGMILIEDDDSGDGPRSFDARIQDFELPEDGVYYILVGRPGSAELYTLTLRIASP
ncbi:MAG TPA: PPC domain-containing protein, partial [Chloroflexota bacterium]|nr:PPC domain-containing protein [Chloroflexota bacterium]